MALDHAVGSSDLRLDEQQVREILARQFPHLGLDRIDYVEEGGDYETFEVNRTFIFRFPRETARASRLQVEIAFLPAIRPAVPLSLPVFEYVGQPSEQYPYAFAGHRKIRGVSGERLRPHRRCRPGIAKQLGQFLSSLHAFPVAKAKEYGITVEPVESVQALLDRVGRFSRVIRSEIPEAINPEIESYLSGHVRLPSPSQCSAVVSHSDLKGEHLILSDRGDAVVGVIDWSDVCVTDPLVDFTGLMIWLGREFVQQVLDHYTPPVDEQFSERVCFYARCFTLDNLGRRLRGVSAAPMELLLTQARWAFS